MRKEKQKLLFFIFDNNLATSKYNYNHSFIWLVLLIYNMSAHKGRSRKPELLKFTGNI